MDYEIDFIGVDKEKAKKDADAISIRWIGANGKQKIVVYDGGFEAHGIAMAENMNKYYFDVTIDDKVIDAVIVSHSDMDHTKGLEFILENFSVKALYMNRPWIYADELYGRVNDGRVTVNSLVKRLKEYYLTIATLEDVAIKRGIPIYDVLEGTVIADELRVLSPSRIFYLDLLTESTKTSCLENAYKQLKLDTFENLLYKASSKIKSLIESWTDEKLKEGESTSAENETSVIVLGDMGDEKFLLVGDAGIRALDKALSYASNTLKVNISNDIKLMQVPHHGGKHNISPSILNRMVGGIVTQGYSNGKSAIVSVAEDSDHPRQIVVNAYIRRGVSVVATRGRIIRHNHNMPQRAGWCSAKTEDFNVNVEKWD